MYLVAIAWMYVVVMMAVAEATSANGSVLGAAVTFVLYGVLPLSIVMYLLGTPARRQSRRRAAAVAEADGPLDHGSESASLSLIEPSSDSESSRLPCAASQAQRGGDSNPPDGGDHPAGDAVAAVRKEP